VWIALLLLRIGDLDAAEGELRPVDYPIFPHKNIAAYRTVYLPCLDEGLVSVIRRAPA